MCLQINKFLFVENNLSSMRHILVSLSFHNMTFMRINPFMCAFRVLFVWSGSGVECAAG